MIKEEIVIVSGVKPNYGGVGQILSYLSNNFSVKMVYPCSARDSIRSFLRRGKLLSVVKEYLIRSENSEKEFQKRIRSIKKDKVIIIHPQSVGFKNVKKLLRNGSKLILYIMDNSFFCLRSYNYIEGFSPCLNCLGGHFEEAERNGCVPFPVSYDINENIEFLHYLMWNSSEIDFWCQNANQVALVKSHFGDDAKTKIVGLMPNDFITMKPYHHFGDKRIFDYVVHANNHEAKGFSYVLEIAKNTPDNTFLFPFNIPEKYNCEALPINIFFIPMSWESGLMFFIQNCEVVICPSLWSAPIEGAFLKSLKGNKKVAVFVAKYSYYNEISDDIVLKLKGNDISEDINRLNEFYNLILTEDANENFVAEYEREASEKISNAINELYLLK